MKLYENETYLEDIRYIAELNLPWENLQDKSFLISGVSGLVGSFLVDVIMYKNTADNLNCKIYGIGRNKAFAYDRFSYCIQSELFHFIQHDINKPLNTDIHANFVLHLASNTHPVAYATDPIGTITTNVFGTYNLLEYAHSVNAERFLFTSSNEVYGENRGDVEKFKEDYCGYIDCNTMRAGYPESKRCGEALCQAFRAKCNMDIVIARLTRSYGPSVLTSDTKVISQFLKNALNHEDIVLKSAGNQFFSYTYVADAVSGLLTVLLKGVNGEAYNIADEKSDIVLKDLAEIIAEEAGTKVIFNLPDAVEAAGFSKATKARLDSTKLQNIGWKAAYDIRTGIRRCLHIATN